MIMTTLSLDSPLDRLECDNKELSRWARSVRYEELKLKLALARGRAGIET